MNLRQRKASINKLRRWAVTPAAADADAVLASATLAVASSTVNMSSVTNPDVARCLVITGVPAGLTLTGNVVVSGKDINNTTISETFALNDDTAVEGTKAFKSIRSITLPARTTEADAIKIGYTDAIGLPDKLGAAHVLSLTIDKAAETVAPTIGSCASVAECTIEPNTSIPGSKVMEVVYLAE